MNPCSGDRSEKKAPDPASMKNRPSPQGRKNTITPEITSLCSAFFTCQSNVSKG